MEGKEVIMLHKIYNAYPSFERNSSENLTLKKKKGKNRHHIIKKQMLSDKT
jgi:hypothetical protein